MCILSSLIFVANFVVRSFFDLQAVIKRFVAQSNDIPKTFVCVADPDKISQSRNDSGQRRRQRPTTDAASSPFPLDRG
jgi:hypothetical protein